MAVETNADTELAAIQTILSTLAELDSQARARVVDYVFRRLGLTTQDTPVGLTELGNLPEPTEGAGALPPPELHDIRSLKEARDPKSAVEMAAIIAYYLAELAPPSERRKTITTAELEKYFKQARYPLPKALRVTLANAASAGYFDSVARGQYKLNPVGYNLVVHGLSGTSQGRRATKTPGKRATKSKAKGTSKSRTKSASKRSTTKRSKPKSRSSS